MPAYVFDSSALVKRYVTETGTAWIHALVAPAAGNWLFLAGITGVEVVAAIARRQKAGAIASADATIMLAALRSELATEYRLVAVSSALLTHAMALAETYALRGYDAVQLAAALEVQAQCRAIAVTLRLVSADAELNTAALREGIPVDDPNAHP